MCVFGFVCLISIVTSSYIALLPEPALPLAEGLLPGSYLPASCAGRGCPLLLQQPQLRWLWHLFLHHCTTGPRPLPQERYCVLTLCPVNDHLSDHIHCLYRVMSIVCVCVCVCVCCVDYDSACGLFADLRRKDPFRLTDLDVFSHILFVMVR